MKKIIGNTEKSGATAMKIGVGIVAVSAAAATGLYFYGSADAKKHRKVVVKWAADMKRVVMQEVGQLKHIDSRKVAAIVDRIEKVYQLAREVTPEDVKLAAAELKENWRLIQGETKRAIHKGESRAKKVRKLAN